MVTMATTSKICSMVYKMLIFDENNQSFQIKRFWAKVQGSHMQNFIFAEK